MEAYPNLRKVIREYPLASGATFINGAFVLATAGEVDECGVDPLVILGIGLHDAGADPDPSIILVALATPESTFVLDGSAAPVAADEGVEYGITKNGAGEWIVDKAKTGASARVFVEKVYIDRAQYEVRVLAANRQITG